MSFSVNIARYICKTYSQNKMNAKIELVGPIPMKYIMNILTRHLTFVAYK